MSVSSKSPGRSAIRLIAAIEIVNTITVELKYPLKHAEVPSAAQQAERPCAEQSEWNNRIRQPCMERLPQKTR